MDSPLRFCLRHALNSMGARLKFEQAIDILALDSADNFFVATVIATAFVENLEFPILVLGKPLVHAQEITGEYRSFIATGTGADL